MLFPIYLYIPKFMNKSQLQKKLKEIDSIVKLQYIKDPNIGALAGLSGLSLFQFYYAKYLDDDTNSDLGLSIISEALSRVNKGYNFPTFCTGIAGTGWVLDHLEQENFLEVGADALLPDLDGYLYTRMVSNMQNGYYDYLHGAIGYGYYFLNRFKNTKSIDLKAYYKKALLEFIELLAGFSEKEGDKIKWISEVGVEVKTKVYNFGLSHGMSSIVGFLARLQAHEDFKEHTDPLLKGGINYILKYKNTNKEAYSMFPNSITPDGECSDKSRVAWCYGDLGIGLQLWHASKVLKDEALSNIALDILKHTARRRTLEKTSVLDAGICHGSFGNVQVFGRMFKETNEPIFKEATDYWLQDGLDKAIHKDGFAGYKQWRGTEEEKWKNNSSLLEGVAGIGLTIIDYLSGFESNWDECLMIS